LIAGSGDLNHFLRTLPMGMQADWAVAWTVCLMMTAECQRKWAHRPS
jgi:hypothetical protein